MFQKHGRKFLGSFRHREPGPCDPRRRHPTRDKRERRERTRPVWFPEESFESQVAARYDNCLASDNQRWLVSRDDTRCKRPRSIQRQPRKALASCFRNLRTMARSYLAMQTFFGSVKKRNASSPPSRPTPLCFMPPKGTRKSRRSQQFTQIVPVLICSATRWARLRFWVQTLDARP